MSVHTPDVRRRMFETLCVSALSAALTYNLVEAPTGPAHAAFLPPYGSGVSACYSVVLSGVAASVGWRKSRTAAYALGFLMGGALGLISLPSSLAVTGAAGGAASLPGWVGAVVSSGYFLISYYCAILAAATAGAAAASPVAQSAERGVPATSVRPTWAEWLAGGRRFVRGHTAAISLCIVAVFGLVVVLSHQYGTGRGDWIAAAITGVAVVLRLVVFLAAAFVTAGAGTRHGFRLGEDLRARFGAAAAFVAAMRRVLGVLAPVLTGYATIVLLFTLAYATVEKFNAGSFNPCRVAPGLLRIWSMFYFSVVTAATVGYGDCSPATGLAQFLVAAEIIASVVYTLFVINAGFSYYKTAVDAAMTEARTGEGADAVRARGAADAAERSVTG